MSQPDGIVHFCPMEIDRLIELLSALSCLLSIWLNTRRKTAGWPIGIISVVLAMWVYFKAGLLAECGLQLFFFVSGLFGWWNWAGAENQIEKTVSVRRLSLTELLFGSGIALTGSALIWFFLKDIPAASKPVPDSLITGFSVLAQVWLARRRLENWLFWIGINLASVGLYLQRELWFFAALYTALFFLAILGYRDWKKSMSEV